MPVTTTRLVDIGQGREQEQGGKRFKDIITIAGVVRSFTLEGQQISHFSASLSMHTVTAEDLPPILLLFSNFILRLRSHNLRPVVYLVVLLFTFDGHSL